MATIGQEEVNVPQSPDVEMKDSHAKSEQKENPLNFRTTLHASDRDAQHQSAQLQCLNQRQLF